MVLPVFEAGLFHVVLDMSLRCFDGREALLMGVVVWAFLPGPVSVLWAGAWNVDRDLLGCLPLFGDNSHDGLKNQE